MRITIAGLALALLSLPGCICALLCPREETPRITTFRDTPELAFETFRAALYVGAADVFYESLSPGFREKYGVPSLAKVKFGFRESEEDVRDLATLLGKAKIVGDPLYAVQDGRNVAWLTIRVEDAEGTFYLVDQPSWNAVVRIGNYPPDNQRGNLPGKDFGSVVGVKDGMVTVGPLDMTDAGVMEASEVLRLSLEHQWLLEDIQKLVNVKPLLERFKAAAEAGGNTPTP